MKILSLLSVAASTATASKDVYLHSSPPSLVLDLRGGAALIPNEIFNLVKGIVGFLPSLSRLLILPPIHMFANTYPFSLLLSQPPLHAKQCNLETLQ